MSLAEALASEQVRVNGSRCSVADLLERLPEADVEALRTALASDMQSSAIVRALGAIGHEIGYTTIRRHRRAECRCGQ